MYQLYRPNNEIFEEKSNNLINTIGLCDGEQFLEQTIIAKLYYYYI